MTDVLEVAPPVEAAAVIDDFHRLLYGTDAVGGGHITWQGWPMQKSPLDLWLYQEIIHELKPELIIETGTWTGGSALYLAHLCDLNNRGHVVTVDIDTRPDGTYPQHPRLQYIAGSSVDPHVVADLSALASGKQTLVILDSDHTREHVLAELQAYAPLVSLGSYLIVEDTDLNDHPVRPDWGPGPYEAVEAFVPEHPEFVRDDALASRYLVSFHTYLKRAEAEPWQPLIEPAPARMSAPLPGELTVLDYAYVPRVLTLVDRDDNNQGIWRTAWPSLEAAAHGLVADWATFNGVAGRVQRWIDAGRYNVLVTPRLTLLGPDVIAKWIAQLARNGLAWIIDTDDDIFSAYSVEREAMVFGSDLEEATRGRQARIDMLVACDGVTVSRPQLAKVVRQYTHRPVHVVPNAIDVQWFREKIAGHRRAVPPLTIGWSGASRELVDFVQLAEAWKRIARRYGHVRFVVQGNDHAHPLLDAVPADRLTVLAWTSTEGHPATLLNMDIGCCPMADTLWNTCKSPNRWAEYSLAGAPVVASPTVYGEYIRDGHDGLIAQSADEWDAQLSRLVEDAELRAELNTNAQARIEAEFSMQATWWRWPLAYAKILGNPMPKEGQFHAETTTIFPPGPDSC